MARKRFQRGSVELRGNTWNFRYREDVMDSEGRIRRVTRRIPFASRDLYPTKRLALRDPFVLRKQTELASFDYRPKLTITLGELIEKWRISVLPNFKPSTRKSAESYLKHLESLKDYTLSGVTTLKLQESVQNWSARGLSAKSIRNLMSLLKSIWITARNWGYVSGESPFEGVILPKREKPKVPFFTLQQMHTIIHEAPEKYRNLFWLAAETGMRAGELAGLRWEDVNCEKGIVSVRQSIWQGREQTPKTPTAIRHFAISRELTERLGACKKPEGYVFQNNAGKPIDPNLIVKRVLQPLLDRLSIPRAGFHAFRHGNITEMDRQGVPLATRVARSGHTELETNMIYTHAVSEDDRKFAQAIGISLASLRPNEAKEESPLPVVTDKGL